MQFNIKEREYEPVLTASSVCIDTSFLFFFFRKIVIKQLWYFTSDHVNLIAITLSKSILKKNMKEKSKMVLE